MFTCTNTVELVEKKRNTTTSTGRAKARESEKREERKNMVRKLDENQTMNKNIKLNTRRTTIFVLVLFHHLWLLVVCAVFHFYCIVVHMFAFFLFQQFKNLCRERKNERNLPYALNKGM